MKGQGAKDKNSLAKISRANNLPEKYVLHTVGVNSTKRTRSLFEKIVASKEKVKLIRVNREYTKMMFREAEERTHSVKQDIDLSLNQI